MVAEGSHSDLKGIWFLMTTSKKSKVVCGFVCLVFVLIGAVEKIPTPTRKDFQ